MQLKDKTQGHFGPAKRDSSRKAKAISDGMKN